MAAEDDQKKDAPTKDQASSQQATGGSQGQGLSSQKTGNKPSSEKRPLGAQQSQHVFSASGDQEEELSRLLQAIPGSLPSDDRSLPPIYDGTDFGVWKAKMEAHLESCNLDIVLSRSRPRRILIAGKDEERRLRDAEIATYLRLEKRVRSKLLMALDTKHSKLVIQCKTPREMWDRLISMHDHKSSASRITLQAEFQALKLDKSEKVNEYIARGEYLAGKLGDCGAKISESLLVGQLLIGLPKRYSSFKTVFMNLDESKHTVNELIARLDAEERMTGGNSSETSKVENALLNESNRGRMRGRFSSRGRFRGRSGRYFRGEKRHNSSDTRDRPEHRTTRTYNEKRKCYNCGKEGHVRKFCRENKIESQNVESPIIEGSMVAEEANLVRDDGVWIVDTGATSHMTFDRTDFISYRKLDQQVSIKFGGEDTGYGVGVGSIKIGSTIDGKSTVVTLHNVLHVPKLRRRLISVSAATDNQCKGEFAGGKLIMRDKAGNALLVARKKDRLYVVDTGNEEGNASIASDDLLTAWHERFCHINKRYLSETSKVVEGMEAVMSEKLNQKGTFDEIDCIGCVKGKLQKHHLPRRETPRATEVGECVHVDIGGPTGAKTFSGSEYYILFKDEFSNYRFIYMMKSREEAFECLRKTVAQVQADTKHRVRYLMSDRGSEFTSRRSQEFLLEQGIIHKTSAPFNPAQNGFIERDNRTLMSGVRAMLYHKKLPVNLWGEASNTLVYVLNRSVNRNTAGRTPYELYFNQKPKVGHLKVFGSLALVKTQTKKRSGYQKKVEERAREGVMVGYEQNYTYRILVPSETGKLELIVTDSAVFDERKSIYDKSEQEYEMLDQFVDSLRDQEPSATDEEEIDIVERQHSYEPLNYRDALASDESREWQDAMQQEYDSLIKNHTWELVEIPKGRKAITCKWVFKLKLKISGEIDKYKARLVARGFTQREGLDYKDTFSPVVRLDTVRILLIIANHLKLEMVQIDVKTAFLNGELDEEIFMNQPEGFEKERNLVCKLKRSIYGLKQASLQWNKCFTKFLREFSLKPLMSDSCVYVNEGCNIEGEESPILIICIYVDDGLIMSNQKKLLQQCVKHLQSKFDITVGSPDAYVGLEIRRDGAKTKLFLSQGAYIKRLLERHGLSNALSVSTPMVPNLKIGKDGGVGIESKDVEVPYREMLGALLYASGGTRPDITFSVNKLASFCEKPKLAHWTALKRICRYLRQREDYGLLNVRKEGKLKLECYSDADHAGCVDTRRSTSGYMLLLNKTPILWKAQKQTIVSDSTCASEFISAALAAKDVIWVRNLLKELGVTLEPTPHYIDNLGTVQLIQNAKVHPKTKHLEIKLFFIRDINHKCIEVKHIGTELQVADILTKPPPTEVFNKLLKLINLTDQARMKAATVALLVVAYVNCVDARARQIVGKTTLYLQHPCAELAAVGNMDSIGFKIGSFESNKPEYVRNMYNWYNSRLCEMQYLKVLEAIQQVEICLGGHKRNKRSILRGATEVAGELVKVGATNFVTSQFKRGSLLGNGDVGTLMSQLSKATIDFLANKLNLGFREKDVREVSQTAELHPTETKEATALMLTMPWAASHVHEEVIAGIANLRTIARYCHSGKVATAELAELVGDPTLAEIDPEDTMLDDVTRGSDHLDFVYTVSHEEVMSYWWLAAGAFGCLGIITTGAAIYYRRKYYVYPQPANENQGLEFTAIRSNSRSSIVIPPLTNMSRQPPQGTIEEEPQASCLNPYGRPLSRDGTIRSHRSVQQVTSESDWEQQRF